VRLKKKTFVLFFNKLKLKISNNILKKQNVKTLVSIVHTLVENEAKNIKLFLI